MKVVLASLFALSLVMPVALAQTPKISTTGTYIGTVPQRCVIKSDLSTEKVLSPVSLNDADGFENGFKTEDTYSFRSNQDCKFSGEGSVISQPQFEKLTDADVACAAGNNSGMAPTTTIRTLTVTVTDNNDRVLFAGNNYKFQCVVTISPL